MLFYTLVLQFYLKSGQKKNDTFLRKKSEEKQNSVTIFAIKLHKYHNVSWVKHATYQKAEPLRAASLSKLGNRVNSNSILNTK